MPSLTQDSSTKWSIFYEACFNRRVDPERVRGSFDELWTAEPIPGTRLVETILKSGAPSLIATDPLIPAYLEQALQSASVDICDILLALLACSKFAVKRTNHTAAAVGDPFVEHVLNLVIRQIATAQRPKNAKEARRALRALSEWLGASNTHDTVLQINHEGLRTPEASVVVVFEAIGTLAFALLSCQLVKQLLTESCPKELKDKLASACNDFVAMISQCSTSPVVARLQMLSRTPPLTHGKPDFTTAEIASAVVDLPVSNSRAGLYTYLNATLCARPLTDDLTLYNHVHAKYGNDTQSMMVDLIVASFDVLANAVQRRQQPHHLLCYRSFIANKLPTLLAAFSGSLFAPMTTQMCIQVALGRVDVHPFPPISSDSDAAKNNTLKNCRRDFVQACILFQLGNEQALTNILAESPSGGPRGVRYIKENLVSQCITNVHRVEELARELEGMTGNAGAISTALVETLQHFCNSKETMSLRTLCNVFSRRLPLIDIVLQYTQPTSLLSPLCNTLNEWTHDEDQSEFQPAYEEFASILLLVLAIIHRYQLSESEIGSIPQDSFVQKLLNNLSNSFPATALNTDQNKYLKNWVQGLYATDEHGETNGISDETMSHCPPQEFYLLVPTLFEQSVMACKGNELAIDTLKGGLEFLLEPFLLPSLIGGLSWITKHSWEDHGDGQILLQVLYKLLRPDSISGDAQAMHSTIIAVVARPLSKSLQELQHRQPNRNDIAPLIEALSPHLDSQRSAKSSLSELNDWCTTSGGGLRVAIKNILNGLVQWTSRAGIDPMPYSYSHRTIVAALDVLGADEVLSVIVDEVFNQTESGSGSTAIEIATALICSPNTTLQPTNSMMQFDNGTSQKANQRRTLRSALRATLENPKGLLSMRTERAEALVRLGRRVDAQSAVPTQMSMPMTNLNLHDISMTDTNMQLTVGDGSNIGETATTNSDFAAMNESLAMDTSGHPDTMSMELPGDMFTSNQDMTFDMSGNTQHQQANQDLNNAFGAPAQSDEDIFSGLDGLDMVDVDDDFNF